MILNIEANNTRQRKGKTMKPNTQPTIENIAQLTNILNIVRGCSVTIGNGSTEWTLKGAYIDANGSYTAQRGTFPSAIATLTRRNDRTGEVFTRRCHFNQLQLVK